MRQEKTAYRGASDDVPVGKQGPVCRQPQIRQIAVVKFMIKIQEIRHSFLNEEIRESEITPEEACRFLHSLSYERSGSTIICESDEDKKRLVKTYYDMYHDEFNIRHNVNDEEQMHLQLAYPATTDVFYVENLIFRFEAGIRELNPRYARVNTHQTVFKFQMSPIYECIFIDNAADEQTKAQMHNLQQFFIHKYEHLNHLSYEDAREYLEYVWSAYRDFFKDGLKVPDIDKIIAINKNFGVPWYKRV